MNAFSSAVSITAHVAIGAAVLFGTTKSARSNPASPRIDTTGRILATSIQVVMATNPGFVAPARQALLATLFRPAMVGGRPVRILVRIPYEFTIRNGTGRAR